MKPVRVVAVDVGGVLFTDGSTQLLHRAPELHPVLRSPQAQALKCGRLSAPAFWRWVATQVPNGWDAEAVRAAWFAAYQPVGMLQHIVSEVKSRRRGGRPQLVVFSGNFGERVDWLEARYPFRHLFDSEVWSDHVGQTKPSPEFVEALIDHAGVAPDQIVYLDDKASALAPARTRGIRCIQVEPGRSYLVRQQLLTYGVLC